MAWFMANMVDQVQPAVGRQLQESASMLSDVSEERRQAMEDTPLSSVAQKRDANCCSKVHPTVHEIKRKWEIKSSQQLIH